MKITSSKDALLHAKRLCGAIKRGVNVHAVTGCTTTVLGYTSYVANSLSADPLAVTTVRGVPNDSMGGYATLHMKALATPRELIIGSDDMASWFEGICRSGELAYRTSNADMIDIFNKKFDALFGKK